MAEFDLKDFEGILDEASAPAPLSADPENGWVTVAARGPVAEGARNSTATRLAGFLLAKGLSAEYTTAILTPWAQAACVPPMDERELRAVVASIARKERGRHTAPEPAAGAFTRPLSTLLAVPDEPIQYLIDRLLVGGANGFVGGEPKSLKSWLALYIAVCGSLAIPLFGRYTVPAPFRVLYIQEEDGERRVRRRVRKILRGLEANPPEDGFFRYSIKAGLLLDEEPWVDALRAEIEAFRPALVVCDVFELMHGKDSDKRAELKPVFYSLSRLQEEYACGFLVVDHFRKQAVGSSKRGGQRLSGTVGKHAWGESSLYLFPAAGRNQVRVETELKDGPSEAFGLRLEDTEDGGVRFTWEPEEDARADEMRGKILEAVQAVGAPGEWVPAKLVAEAAGVSPNTASKWLNVLTDEDQKLERERRPVGKTTRAEWRLRV